MSLAMDDLTDLSAAHLDGAVALSRAAGWPHRREDWQMQLALSTGFAVERDGRLAGTALVTRFGECATINMVIVDEALRGRGLGQALMRAAIDGARGRSCRLVATQEGLPLYEKLGFRAAGRIVQHQGTSLPVDPAGAHDLSWSEAWPLARLCALDKAACGMDRRALFELLVKQGRLALLRDGSGIAGFAVLRPFGRGEVIGPVVAPGAEAARALIAFVMAGRAGAFLRVDAPEESGLGPWFTACGLAPAGGGIVMHRGGAPDAGRDGARTFALASQALG